MVAMKGTLPHTTPFFLAGFRLVPAGILILIAALWMKREQPKGWAAWLWIIAFGIVDGALFQGFLAEGLVRTGAGLGSVMIDSQPLAVALMARIFFGERIGLWGVMGLAFGIVGISLLGLPDAWIMSLFQDGVQLSDLSLTWQDGITRLFQSGEWLMLMAALSMAVGTVMVRGVCRYADPVTATGWHMIIGGIPLFALSGGLETQQWAALNLGDWMALGYSTIFGSAIAYALFFHFASTGNLTSFSSLTFLTPVFALLFGSVLLSEVLSQLQWIGVGFTLVSIYLINQRDVLATRFRLNQLFTNAGASSTASASRSNSSDSPVAIAPSDTSEPS